MHKHTNKCVIIKLIAYEERGKSFIEASFL